MMSAAAPCDVDRLRTLSDAVRRSVLQRAYAAGVGHIGSALSVVEILATLFGGVLHRRGSSDPHRDHFILSKGHAALALYAVLHEVGLLDETELASYGRDGTRLGVHPEAGLPGVDVSTGSLGQGFSIGCGLALGLRQK